MKGMIVVRVERCLGCKSCELACAVEHSASQNLFQAITEAPLPKTCVNVVQTEGTSVPLMCRHCEDAPCVVVCPSKALEKSGSEQPVMVSADRCIGCKLCMLVCPFGVILFNQDKKAAFKCDICLQRQAAGKPPACVAACKSGSLQLVSLEEFTRKKRQQAATTLKKAEDAGRLVLQPD